MRRIFHGLRGNGGGGGFLLGAAAVVAVVVWAIRRKKVSAEQVEATADAVGAQVESVVAAVESAVASGDTTAVAEVAATASTVAVQAEAAAVQAETAAVTAEVEAAKAESKGAPKASGLRTSASLFSSAARNLRVVADKAKVVAETTKTVAKTTKDRAPAVSTAEALRAAQDKAYDTATRDAAVKAAKALSNDRVVMAVGPGATESQVFKAYRRAVVVLVANRPPPMRVRSGRFLAACETGAAKAPIWSQVKALLQLAAEIRSKVVAARRDPETSVHTAPASWVSTYGSFVKAGLANVAATTLKPACNADLEKYLYTLKADPPDWTLRGVDLSGRLGGQLYSGGGLLSLRGRL